jgi:hypothetical protein
MFGRVTKVLAIALLAGSFVSNASAETPDSSIAYLNALKLEVVALPKADLQENADARIALVQSYQQKLETIESNADYAALSELDEATQTNFAYNLKTTRCLLSMIGEGSLDRPYSCK